VPNSSRPRERFDADPSDRAAFELLEEHHFLAAEWSKLVPLYEAHLAATAATRPPADRARLLFRMGQAIEEGLDDAERAAASYRAALELDPGFVPALRRLRGVCLAQGGFREAIEIAAREAALAPGPEAAAGLVEIAERALSAGDAHVAANCLEQALALCSDDARALLGLPRALETAGRLNEAVAAWEQAATRLSGVQRNTAIRALGALLAGPLTDPERALQHFQRACDDEPATAEWIESVFSQLVTLERFEAAAALGARRIERATDSRQRAAIAMAIGRLHLDRLAAPSEARAWFERAAEWCDDGTPQLALAEAASRLGDTVGRSYYLERAMELGAEIPEWSDLGLGDPLDAAGSLDGLRTTASERPDDPNAQEALAAALGESGNHAERVAVLERRAALPGTDRTERAELWLEIGEIYEQNLDDPAAAAHAYRCALGADPERALGDGALETVLRRMGRLGEMAEALAPALATATPARRAAMLCRLGAIALEAGNAAQAIESFKLALECDPESGRARSGLLRAAEADGDDKTIFDLYAREAARCDLDRLAELGREALRRSATSDDPDAAVLVVQRWAERAGTREAHQALVALFEESGRTDELVAALERLDTLLDGTERAANRRRLGYLHAAEGRPDDAIDAWREALGHDATDLASLEALAEALAEANREAELIALCDERGSEVLLAPHVEGLRAGALERAGRLPEAAARFRALRDAGAVDAESLAGLERTARATGDIAMLESALALRAAHSSDPALRDRCVLERAELLDVQLDRAAEAAAVYGELEERASDAPLRAAARQRLDALLERAGRFDALCERLEARLASSAPEEAARLHERIAELAEAQLGDRDRARRHLAAAVARVPARAETWRRLAALCDEASDVPALASALEGELGATDSNERKLALNLQIARLASQRLADETRAEKHFRAALAIDAGHGEAHDFVAERLEGSERWRELAELLQARLDTSPPGSPQARTSLRLRLARVLAEGAGLPADAIAPLEAARNETGAVTAIARPLALLYGRVGRQSDEIELCAAAAEQSAGPAEAAGWWTRAGDTSRAIGDDARAADFYRRAVAQRAGSDTARHALVALLRARRDAAALVPILEADLDRPDRDGLALRVEIASLYEQLGQRDRACPLWMGAAALAPDDVSLRERAFACALSIGRDADAATLLRASARDPRSRDRAALWRRCGELFATAQPSEAIAAWEESLVLDRAQPTLRRARRELLEAVGRSEEALAELTVEFASATPAERAELAARGADLAVAHAGAAAAAPWLARLEAERPDDADLWVAIARLHRLAQRTDAQERALGEAARRCTDRATAGALHRERAALLEAAPATHGRALAALEAARAQTPADPELLAALDRHYSERARWRDLLGVLELRMARANGAERGSLCRRAAACAETLGEISLAATLWRDALAPGLLAPDRRASVLPRAVDAQRSARCIESFVGLAEEELGSATGTRRATLLRTVAHALRDHLGQPARALVHLRALADEPGNDARDRADLFAALRSAGACGELAGRLAVQLNSNPADCVAWRELAELREEMLFDAAGAADAWRAFAEREPRSRTALAGLRRSAERLGDAPELARVLEREIEVGAHEPAGLWRRLARVRLDALGDVAGAERAFAAARAADPRDFDSLRELARLAEAREDWQTALARYAEEIEALGDAEPVRRRALWLRIADRAAGPARDLPRAAEAFECAEAIETLDAPSLAAWAGVLRELGGGSRWRTVFAAFCDHPETKADVRDHLALAQSLADAGARDEAARRLAPVFAREPANAGAWALSARLREAAGDPEGATLAWTRAAEASSGLDAARAFRAAAAPWESSDADRALELLTRAVDSFASFAPAHAALAITAERLGRHEVAIHAASSALSGDAVAAPLTRDERFAAALAGTRSAYAMARWPAAWELAGEVLALEPEHADGWLARGVAAFHLGSPAASCRGLEAWLATEPPDASRPAPLCVLASALAAQGDDAGALARYREALAIDPVCDEAHAGRSELFERRGESADAASAFAEWADCTAHEAPRADRYVRAARLARAASDGSLPVEAWLCAALDAQRAHAQAWLDLSNWLSDAGREEDAFRAACEGAACVDVPSVTAALEVRRAVTLEARGDEAGACRAYQRAAQLDADAAPAAFAAARLLRRTGAWSEAATLLGDFAARHRDAAARAELLIERGRLLAGPLEDVASALDAYRAARDLAPERLDVREALGALLAQVPASGAEAQSELVAVLRAEPLRTSALRRLAHLLRGAGREREADRAMAILRALGAASPGERASASDTLGFAIGAARLDVDGDELMREAILAVAGDWSQALPPGELTVATPDPSIAHVKTAWDATLRNVAGPALAALAPDAFARGAEALACTALGIASSLATSDEALDMARRMSGRATRRLRRALGSLDAAGLRRFDFDAWTASLRGLALACAVDCCDGDLRAALLCAQQTEQANGSPPAPVELDLVPWIQGSGAAREVVSRTLRAFLDSL
jgi:tetratricopeptide (TPR) repeat protein